MMPFHVKSADREFKINYFSSRLTSERDANVVVRIMDENDSPPRFTKEEFTATLLLPTFQV